jgi:hypothetical protein
MGQGLSMATKREITKQKAREYERASKKEKGRILDELAATIGWSRANARRQLKAAGKRKGPASAVERKPKPRTYGYDTLKVLQLVWTLSGEPCGKYLAPIMVDMLESLERFGELKPVEHRLNDHVRRQLVAMSPATIDRLLKPAKDARYPDAVSTTRPGSLLRSEIPVRQALDEMEQRPGFLEIDLVAHCGHSLEGEFAYTLTATDVFTGWTENIAIKNRAHKWVVQAMTTIAQRLPYPMAGLDCDNGGEFINHALVGWAAERTLFMTRSRPHESNDNAHVEQKNGDIVRKSAFRYRYDTPAELSLLNELWGYVNLRKNLFLPTKKANGWRTTRSGRSTRTYDAPKTPFQRVIDSGVLSTEKISEIEDLRRNTNPAGLTRNIVRLQQELIKAAKTKTLAFRNRVS